MVKYKNVKELIEKSPVVDFASIERASKKGYSKQLVRNMVLSGKLKRLAKGCYTKYDEPSLAVYCFKPSYLGLQDAMSYHELWEQETIPVIITSRNVRGGLRKVMGTNTLVRRLGKNYMFGYELVGDGQFFLPYSDVEKTFIDMVYFKERISEESLLKFRERIDKKKLADYLKRFPERVRKRVFARFKQ